jgi:chromosomal replication initiation ATPase DnaA
MTRQIPLPLPHDVAMGGDDFLVTPSNQDAAAWIGKWPDWPGHGLIVTGPSASGKTHLLNLWLAKSKGQLITQPLFLLPQNVVELATQNKNIAIDNVSKIVGNAAAEEALFHLYNHLKSEKGSLVLALQQPVGQAGFVLPDLRSRLLTLPVAALGAPDDDLLAALIVKQFRDRQISLDAGVVAYLTPRMPREAWAARALVEKLDQESLAEGRKITIALARKILENV